MNAPMRTAFSSHDVDHSASLDANVSFAIDFECLVAVITFEQQFNDGDRLNDHDCK